jgi:hypothetical protein
MGPPPAAARRRFHHDRVANLFRCLLCLRFRLHHSVRAGEYRQPQLGHGLPRFVLIAHQKHDVGARSDECYLGNFADLGERSVFRQKAVTGMNCFGVGDFGGGNNAGDIQVAIRTFGRTYANCLVGKTDGERIAVSLGINGDRLNSEFFARANHAQRDFTTVGNENLFKHRRSFESRKSRCDSCEFRVSIFGLGVHFLCDGRMANKLCPYSTGCPFSMYARTISPATSDSISFISFMASMMHNTCPT